MGAEETKGASSETHGFSFTRMIDLSVGIIPDAPHEPWKPSIRYPTHEREGLDWIKTTFGAKEEDLIHPRGKGAAFEEVTAITHSGAHADAPWHYGPQSEGKPAKKIDELPIEWFFSDGVVLDLRHKRPGEKISAQDLEEALERIGYVLKPFDIVMITNGRDRDLGSTKYFEQSGMTRESALWLVEQGIKVIGVDMYGFDRKFEDMAREFLETGDGRVIWKARFAGIEREYCQIEKLANLDKIPHPTGFKVACFPIKVQGASGGWCRPVAFV